MAGTHRKKPCLTIALIIIAIVFIRPTSNAAAAVVKAVSTAASVASFLADQEGALNQCGLGFVADGAKFVDKAFGKVRSGINYLQTQAAKVHPVLGGIANIAGSLLGSIFGGGGAQTFQTNPENLKAIKEGFQGMRNQFDNIDKKAGELWNKLNAAKVQTEWNFAIKRYRDVQNKLFYLQKDYTSLLQNANRESAEKFLEQCKTYDATETFRELYYILGKDKDEGGLTEGVKKIATNRQELMLWIATFTRLTMDSMMLRQACLGAQYKNYSEAILAQATDSENKLNQVLIEFEKLYTEKMNEWIQLETNNTKGQTADVIYAAIEKKYNVSEILVATFDSSTPRITRRNRNQSFVPATATYKLSKRDTTSYVTWCEEKYGNFYNEKSMNAQQLEGAEDEILELYDECKKRDYGLNVTIRLKRVRKFLAGHSPAFREARSMLLLYVDGENKPVVKGGEKCSKHIKDVCGGKYEVILSY